MKARYELLAPIAEGGLGTVFRALDRELGSEVAIKRLRPDPAKASAASLTSLLNEARRQSSLNSPHIVRMHAADMDEEGGYIVMELVRGETLEDRLSRGPMSGAEFDALVRQTLAGLGVAHEAGIIHLDLKPENIMLVPQPEGGMQVKILDFGLARELKLAAPQTRPDTLQGSIYFMAPEQFENAPTDARTDLYMLGCVFYYALTRQHPFEGDTKPQVMVAHLYHRTTALAQLRPDLPAAMVRWVEWLTSRQPVDRPASVAEALQAYPMGD